MDNDGGMASGTGLRTIAYHALWELRDLNPAAEPAHFRRTRLDLHRELEDVGPGLAASAPADRHLRAVGGS